MMPPRLVRSLIPLRKLFLHWPRPAAGVEPLEARIALATISWDGGGDGVSWTNPNNWSNDAVPTSTDDVPIAVPAATITINLTGTQAVNTLTMTGDDTLSLLNSSLTLGGSAASSISNLALTGSGTVSTVGDLTLTGASTMANDALLGGTGKILLTGTLTGTGGAPDVQTELQVTGTLAQNADTLEIRGATAKVRVLAGGVFNASNANIQRPSGGLGLFVEDGGTFHNTAGSVTTFGALFVDGGAVNVTGGSLIFNLGTSLHDTALNGTVPRSGIRTGTMGVSRAKVSYPSARSPSRQRRALAVEDAHCH